MDNIDYQDKIIQSIKRIRIERDISQAKLSEILGISRGQIGNIENPNYPHKYTLKQIMNVCEKLDVPIEQIFIPDQEVKLECSLVIKELMDNVIKYE
ncbi:MAG: helix-turn-helix domain-containing protein [Bacteroidales bacterium]|nr:helix-turn-helix domain-containing protein [Bacteroidales bacterium]